MAYLLTFCAYGTHLPGSAKGWVDGRHSVPGSPVRAHDPEREANWRLRLNEIPFLLGEGARDLALQVILTVCSHRGWKTHAVHVRTTHAHAVLTGDAAPERMLSDLKAYVTHALRSEVTEIPRRRYWADHGSTRYLWNEKSLKAAIHYVLDGQGIRMACHPERSETSTSEQL